MRKMLFLIGLANRKLWKYRYLIAATEILIGLPLVLVAWVHPSLYPLWFLGCILVARGVAAVIFWRSKESAEGEVDSNTCKPPNYRGESHGDSWAV